jgi:hypothetical protein
MSGQGVSPWAPPGAGPKPVDVTESGATQYQSGPQGYPGAVEDHPGWNFRTGTCSAHPSGCADSAPGAGSPHPWKGDLDNTAAGREAGSERGETQERYANDPRIEGGDESGTEMPSGWSRFLEKWTFWGSILKHFGGRHE